MVGILLLSAGPARGEQPESSAAESRTDNPGDEQPAKMMIEMRTGDTDLTESPGPAAGRLARWLELETAALSTRYHFIQNSAGVTTSNQAQYEVAVKARLKLDSSGHYSVHAGVFSGNSFSGGWNATGWGTGAGRTNLYLKQLFFSAQPVAGLEFETGSLYFRQGQTTEITGYDYDGYATGHRLTVSRPKELFFDAISVTYGIVGDFGRPSVGQRLHRLNESNYHQFLVEKKFGKRVGVSADYSFESGVDTLRQGLRVQMPGLRVVDALHFENYEVVGRDAGYGFAAYGEKKLHSRVSLGGGYAQHDRTGLYSDRFAAGKRVFLNLLVPLGPEFSFSAGITQALENEQSGAPRTRVDIAFNYNLLRTLRRAGLF